MSTENTPAPDLVAIRAALARMASYVGGDMARWSVIADALLLLLPPTPVEDRHTVDDVPPNDIIFEDPGWALGDHSFRVVPGKRHSVQWKQDNTTWHTTPEEAEEFAAVLLSAVARARRAAQ